MNQNDTNIALLSRARRRRLAALHDTMLAQSPHKPPAHVPPVTQEVVVSLMERRKP